MIVGVGLRKTGTTSLHTALGILGFCSLHDNRLARKRTDRAINEELPVLHYLQEYNAFCDHPFCEKRVWSRIDRQYQGVRFIWTVREEDGWLDSAIEHNKRWNRRNPRNRRPLDIEGVEHLCWEYRQNAWEVKGHFGERKDFLTLNICAGEGWEKLCPFLGVGIPNTPFPHRGKRN